jgi:hypothetical protein
VLLREMFSSRMRGEALAVSAATNFAANFGVTVTFLPILRVVGLSGTCALCPGRRRLGAVREDGCA